MHVDPVEGLWLGVNAVTVIVTAFSLWDALRARAIVHRLNGRAREIVANQNVRREIERLIKALLLASVIVPSLFSDRPIVLTWPIFALIAVPVVMMFGAIADAFTRRRLIRMAERNL